MLLIGKIDYISFPSIFQIRLQIYRTIKIKYNHIHLDAITTLATFL